MGKGIKRILSLVIVLSIFVSVSAPGASAANNGGTYSYVEGDTVSFIKAVLQSEEKAEELSIASGKMPSGLNCTTTYYESESQTYLVFSGKVNESGTFKFTLRVSGSYGGYEDYDFTFNVKAKASTGGVSGGEAGAELKVTKSPTSETVTEGGKATFISAAENYSALEWRIVTADGSACWRNKSEVESKFSGVSYSAFVGDDNKEYLVLSKIPMSMNGYYVQTKFWSMDKDGTAFTEQHAAKITVNEAALEAPKFTKQPEAAEMKTGSNHTLECTASAKNGTVSYQWYKSGSNSTVGGQKIEGATSSRFIPEQLVGQSFYYCAAWAGKDGRTSDTVYSNVVAVTYAAPETPTPSPSPTPTPTPAPTLAPDAKDEQKADDDGIGSRDEREQRRGTGLFIVMLIASAVALAGVAAYLVISSKKEKAGKARPAAPAAVPKGWRCPFCGQLNQGRFCQNCGKEKPQGALQYACDKCGWKPADPTNPPRFCPNCGDPFGDEDRIK